MKSYDLDLLDMFNLYKDILSGWEYHFQSEEDSFIVQFDEIQFPHLIGIHKIIGKTLLSSSKIVRAIKNNSITFTSLQIMNKKMFTYVAQRAQHFEAFINMMKKFQQLSVYDTTKGFKATSYIHVPRCLVGKNPYIINSEYICCGITLDEQGIGYPTTSLTYSTIPPSFDTQWILKPYSIIAIKRY